MTTDAITLAREALELIAGTDPVDAALDPQRAVRVAHAALSALSEAGEAGPMAARVSATCESSPGGHYTVKANFASLREAQAAHSWLTRLTIPSAPNEREGNS